MAFSIRTSKPGAGNKNFIRTVTGGWNTCIYGSPTDKECNVLANCVGYASGRFNEIINQVRGTSGCAYKTLNCNAENFVERALAAGLKIGSTPKVGAIMCWQKGTLSSPDGAGHVAIVERVNSSTSVYTAESGYGSKAFWNQTRTKGNGSWGLSGSYSFRCFIYLPDDVQAGIGGSTPEPTPAPTPSDKFNIGDKVVINGPLYTSSNAASPAGSISNKITEITRKAPGTAHPYNTTGDLGWMNESSITKHNEAAPAPQPIIFNVGDTVIVNGVGRSTSYGTGSSTRNYSGNKAKIIYIRDDGRSHPYALNLNNNMNGVTGWFTKSSISK